MANQKSKVQKILESVVREKKKAEGFFDGRFSTKVYHSKKMYSRKRKHKGYSY